MAAPQLSYSTRFSNYWVNEGPKVVFMGLFMAANIALFIHSFIGIHSILFLNSYTFYYIFIAFLFTTLQ